MGVGTVEIAEVQTQPYYIVRSTDNLPYSLNFFYYPTTLLPPEPKEVLMDLQIGDLYTHDYHRNLHVLIEICKSCVHLVDLTLGIERTIRNDTFKYKWTRIGGNQ